MSKDIRIAIILGILAFIGVIVQMMFPVLPQYIGWPIIGTLSIIAILLVLPNKRKMNIATISNPKAITELKNDEKSHHHKVQGQNIHRKIIELDSDLENETYKHTKDENWKEIPEIRQILAKLQTELNEFGYLVKSRDFDRWAEALMHNKSKRLEFHMRETDSHYSEWGHARINARLRDWIKKIKG